MKGIILAGGSGTRLHPLTKGINKHLLPVGKKPMILHPILKLQEFGIKDVLVITGPESLTPFAQLLGDGSEWGMRLYFRAQPKPGGIAEALNLGREFVGGESFWVLLGDNLFGESLASMQSHFPLKEDEAFVVLKEVPNPEQFGIAEMKDNRIVDVVEKPKTPKGNLCVTGVYAYTPKVFDVIQEINPSARGELEISAVNQFYAQAQKLKHHIFKDWWLDAGTMEDFLTANEQMKGTES
ncbi:MAG: sugar phosphate nucleotidyltransferase [Deltaproteobacteria bacterium]|nr:sugar phosphate nucleotidyltransferase [Deltaproteobacteria bacterium]